MNNKGYLYLFIPLQVVYLLLGIVFYSSAKEEGALYIRNYSPIEYLANSQNWAVIQGDNGLLYFGNNSGVLEYDGENWRLIELQSQSIVRALAKDETGKIYVGGGCDFGYLQEDQYGRMVYHSLVDKLEKEDCNFSEVWYVHCNGEDVYFVTDQSLVRLRNGEIKKWKADQSFGPCFSINNETYIHYWEKGIVKMGGDSIVEVPKGDYFKELDVWFYLKLPDNRVLVGTIYSGLYTINYSLSESGINIDSVQKFPVEDKGLFKDEVLYSACLLPNGNFAVGSTTSGVFILNEQGQLIRKINDALRNNMIYSIMGGRDDNLWLATNNGISKVDLNTPISFWDINSGIESGTANVCRFEETLFVGGFRGIQYLERKKIIKVPGFTGECLCMINYKLPQDTTQTKLLAGTIDHGIIDVNKTSFQTLFDLDPWDLYQSKIDLSILYIAMENGLYIAKYDNDDWKLLGKVDSISENILQIEEDDVGSIWLCTSQNGIIRIIPSSDPINPSKISYYGKDDGLPGIIDPSTYKVDNSFVFSVEEQLLVFDKDTERFIQDSTFGVAFHGESCEIYNIEKDKKNRFWISGAKDKKDFLQVFQKSENGDIEHIEANILKLLPPMTIETIYVDEDNTIWIGGSEGLFRFNGELNKEARTIKTLIREVKTKNDSLLQLCTTDSPDQMMNDKDDKTKIDFSQNWITFQYASPSFTREEAIKYQTWLEGEEKSWSAWNLENKREYQNLKEGKYVFHVRSKNISNSVGDEAVYKFVILPPWYRTFWAILLFLICGTGFVILIVYLNGKRMIIANNRMEKLVKVRTNEVLQQKDKILVQSEKLQILNEELQKQNSKIETQRDELENSVATKNRFFNIIAHDLKSPFNSLIGLSDLLKSDNITSFTPENIQEINNLINKSAIGGFALLENLLEWARAQTNHIEHNPQKISIKQLVEESFHHFTGPASAKKIALNMDIEEGQCIFADPYMVNTVLRNLVSNAIKFSEENKSIEVFTKEYKNEIAISVKDHGVGIEGSAMDKFFKLDYKVSTQGTANETGTGLGLLLCKEFVEKNKGTIKVESKLNVGSIFTVTFPSFLRERQERG